MAEKIVAAEDLEGLSLVFRAAGHEDDADAIGTLFSLSTGRHPFASEGDLLMSRYLAKLWNLPDDLKGLYSAAYARHQAVHVSRLEGAVTTSDRFITIYPGVLSMPSRHPDSFGQPEPLVSLILIDRQEDPYKEAHIVAKLAGGETAPLDNRLRCDLTMFPEPLQREVLADLIANHAKID